MSSVLSAAHFHNEEAAYAYVEAHLWPNGPFCPFCGATKRHVGRLQGKTTRPGLYKCYACRKPFTVKIGTVMEASHVPLRIWLQAIYLLCSSKKGISTRQLQRTLQVGMKTAWFLGHRIREAMKLDGSAGPLGGEGKVVEADETYYGPKQFRRNMHGRIVGIPGPGGKAKIMTLVERGGGARSTKVADFTGPTVRKVLSENASRKSRLHTDESGIYPSVGLDYAKHESVKHGASEYVRGDVTTNTVEGFFSNSSIRRRACLSCRSGYGSYWTCRSQGPIL